MPISFIFKVRDKPTENFFKIKFFYIKFLFYLCYVSNRGYINLKDMNDLEKRLSINKVNLHVGLKFTTRNDGIVYEITSISGEYLKVGWDGIKDRVDYLICKANIYFSNGDWKVYGHSDKFANPQQQPSLEQDIQQLKDKYKQYKFTITIEDNI